MKAFMDKDFMLQSATARHLYHDYAGGKQNGWRSYIPSQL